MTTQTLISGTQEMQLKITFIAGSGWICERFDLWKGEWEKGALASQQWHTSIDTCKKDLEARSLEFLKFGWSLK